MATTIGRLLLDEALPADMRDPDRRFDGSGVKKLFAELAERHPEQYADVNLKLNKLATKAVSTYGNGASFSLKDFSTPDVVKKLRDDIREKIEQIHDGPGTAASKNAKVVALLSDNMDSFIRHNYAAGEQEDNAFVHQIVSGARGNKVQFMSLRVGDILVSDHKNRPIPVPLLNSYSEGLDPVQYWAAAYGARRGTLSTKLAVPKAGFLGKQLFQASNRLIVTEKDCGTTNGIPVMGNDSDNEGATLARDFGDLKSGTSLTSKNIKTFGDKPILVRSPITCQAENGICQKCAGKREADAFPALGSNIGAQAAQATSEPLTQVTLGEKHVGGVAVKKTSGLDFIGKMVSVPENFPETVPVARVDGRVESIEDAPQGGKFVTINKTQHWVPPDVEFTHKINDVFEAGDALAGGIANPAEVVKYKGVGEGRRYFMEQFRKTLDDNRAPAHRRNIELLARGLVNHIRVTDLDGPAETVPDDLVEYDNVVRNYTPRFGFKKLAPKAAVGLYLEQPTLHYSIGTRVTPRVAASLGEHGVNEVMAHADKPSFEPEMTRAMENLTHSPDWMTRLGGFYLQRGFLDAARRGSDSPTHGTSFITPLSQGTEFGKVAPGKGY